MIDLKQLKKIKLNKGKRHVSSSLAPLVPPPALVPNEVCEENTASADPTFRLETGDQSFILCLPPSSQSLGKRPRL
ncbi:conserved hypothetical protein [Ricinus communis]|uniref:Uncharacterized protein n=1 Tax=Ricinus communis TaxID=3988 RepID=B9T1X3_RICCO|nr:conserved hypothetical protein [Ricinus communis]